MIIDRRAFVAGAAFVAFAPMPEFLLAPLSAPATNVGRFVLMVDGWNVPGDGGTAEEVWIRVGRSWRTTWR